MRAAIVAWMTKETEGERVSPDINPVTSLRSWRLKGALDVGSNGLRIIKKGG